MHSYGPRHLNRLPDICAAAFPFPFPWRAGEEAEEENDQQEKEQTDADPPRADEGETSAAVNGSDESPLDEEQLSKVCRRGQQ